MKNKSFIELYKEEHYRKAIVDALCQGIHSQYIPSFKSLLEYVITDKYDLFDRDEFKSSLYLDEDETLNLILPAVRRVFGKIFIDPPTLFKDSSYVKIPESLRYKLFIMYFNADEFIDYLVDMFIKSKDCLQHFEHIDRTSETLTLIVDNYVAGLVQRVRDVENHQEEIDNLIKQIRREETIEQVFDKIKTST